jgi:hypothetical protein
MTYGKICMVVIEQLAKAAVDGDALLLRSLTQDWLAENPKIGDCPAPASTDAKILAISAGIIELFAQRRAQSPPEWTKDVAALDRPLHLLKSAKTMPRLRKLCEAESPMPLRRRNLFAPPTFLQFA